MNAIADTLVGLIEEAPLLGRVFFASIELAALGTILALAVKLKLVRTYRLQAVLWLLILLNVLSGVLMKAPYSVPLWRGDHPAAAMPAVAAHEPHRPLRREARAAGEVRSEGTAASTTTAPVPPPAGLAPPKDPSQSAPLARWSPGLSGFIFLAWIVGILGMGGHLVLERLRLQGLLRRAGRPGAILQTHYEREAAALGIRWMPLLRVTGELESPAIAGVFRPVILVPQWLVAEGSKEQWSWTLRHELTHWRHGDTVGQMLRLIVQAFFFFHPMAWWAGKRWEEAAEMACDRSLLKSEQDAVGYAAELCKLLGMIGKRRRPTMSTGLFASRSHIGQRIETLLADPLSRPARLRWGHRLLAALVLAAFLGLGFGAADSIVAPAMPAITRIVSAAAPGGEAPPERVLRFPDDYSMGSLDVGDGSRDARGDVAVPEGEMASLQVNEAGAADLSPLATFGPNDLQIIVLAGSTVQDEQLAHIAGLTGLRELILEQTPIGDEGMAHLAGLTQLRSLNIDGTQVGDAGMAFVEGMTEMRDLELNRSLVGDVGLSYIRNMAQLTELDMWMLDISDAGMANLAGLVKLQKLGMEDTLISDDGLRYLEGLEQLYLLNLENNNITDAGLASLVKLPMLSQLGLSDTYVTDAGMALLADAPSLSAARLPVQIGPEGLKYFEGTPLGQFLATDRGVRTPVDIAITGGGRPLSSAYFLLTTTEGHAEREVYFYRTDGAGKARVFLPESSVPYRLRAYAAGFVTGESVWPVPFPGQTHLELDPASVIGGTVMNESGRPVAGVSVSVPVLGAHNWDTEESLPHVVTTGADGTWRCDVVPRDLGDFWVALEHPDYSTTTYSLADLPVSELRSGSAILRINDPIGMSGVVVGDAGEPLEGVRVSMMKNWKKYKTRPVGRAAITDAEGNFEIRPAQPGEMMLRLEAQGIAPRVETVTVSAGMEPARFVMEAPAGLRGRLVNNLGIALGEIEVWCRVEDDNNHRLAGWRGKTDGDGRFSWPDAPDGKTVLILRDPVSEENHTISDVHAGKEEQSFTAPFRETAPPLEPAGIEEGTALLDRFNQAHARERFDNIEISLTWSFMIPDRGLEIIQAHTVTRAGDGRYRGTQEMYPAEGKTERLRCSWDGSVYVRQSSLIEGEAVTRQDPYIVDSQPMRELHDMAIYNCLLLLGDDWSAKTWLVYQYKDGVLSMGERDTVRARIHFTDPDKLAYDWVEYFDQDGKVISATHASEWYEFDGIQLPAKGFQKDGNGNVSNNFTVDSLKLIDPKTEEFLWEIPWELGVQIKHNSLNETADVTSLDERLIREKKYLEAFARLRDGK